MTKAIRHISLLEVCNQGSAECTRAQRPDSSESHLGFGLRPSFDLRTSAFGLYFGGALLAGAGGTALVTVVGKAGMRSGALVGASSNGTFVLVVGVGAEAGGNALVGVRAGLFKSLSN
jgi:hypothetical protein